MNTYGKILEVFILKWLQRQKSLENTAFRDLLILKDLSGEGVDKKGDQKRKSGRRSAALYIKAILYRKQYTRK